MTRLTAVAYDSRLTWAFWWALLYGAVAVGSVLFADRARGADRAAWADLYGSPAKAAAPHRCATCGFDCRCGRECKCPQAGDPRYANARVREESDDPPKPAANAATPAGQKFLRGGWWYTADGQGGGYWCTECNGMTLEQAKAWWADDQRKRATPAPGVAATPVFHGDHTCPQCGAAQYVVARSLPNGQHVHTCSRCGLEWRH